MDIEHIVTKGPSHDHLIECYSCHMTIRDIRDCTCDRPSLFNHVLCGHCREDRDYKQVEAARNWDY